jgi:hypothetical protein
MIRRRSSRSAFVRSRLARLEIPDQSSYWSSTTASTGPTGMGWAVKFGTGQPELMSFEVPNQLRRLLGAGR